jgi:predicted transcriptional regulator
MSDDKLIELIESSEEWTGRPFTHAQEIAKEVDMTRQAVRYRLEEMVEQGELRRYKPSRDVIYWR